MSRTTAVSWIAVLTVGVVFALEHIGALAAPELALYDAWIRMSASEEEAADPRIVVIELREQDLGELGHWPVSDRVLGEALEQLSDSEAVAIGIDWYRNLPVPPGEAVLERALRADPRIVGVRKFGDARAGGVDGPPFLEQTGRVGFNDLPIDERDETIRRGLLYQDDGVHEVETSFSLRLALLAPPASSNSPRSDPSNPDWVRLGPTTVAPLSSRFGGYAGIDAAGYQYLIDYARISFPTFTFGELLRGEIPPAALRDHPCPMTRL